MENGIRVLYLSLLKALYGCMWSEILWYNLYTKTLISHEFVVNPYDRCISNSIIYGKQCTIAWCVDGNKASHVNEKVNTNTIEKIAEDFGELTVMRKNINNWECT